MILQTTSFKQSIKAYFEKLPAEDKVDVMQRCHAVNKTELIRTANEVLSAVEQGHPRTEKILVQDSPAGGQFLSLLGSLIVKGFRPDRNNEDQKFWFGEMLRAITKAPQILNNMAEEIASSVDQFLNTVRVADTGAMHTYDFVDSLRAALAKRFAQSQSLKSIAPQLT